MFSRPIVPIMTGRQLRYGAVMFGEPIGRGIIVVGVIVAPLQRTFVHGEFDSYSTPISTRANEPTFFVTSGTTSSWKILVWRFLVWGIFWTGAAVLVISAIARTWPLAAYNCRLTRVFWRLRRARSKSA